MAQKNIHVIKNNDVWQVKREGSQRASKNFDTQKEAIQYAIPGAKKRSRRSCNPWSRWENT